MLDEIKKITLDHYKKNGIKLYKKMSQLKLDDLVTENIVVIISTNLMGLLLIDWI
jgi:hypothetical protein